MPESASGWGVCSWGVPAPVSAPGGEGGGSLLQGFVPRGVCLVCLVCSRGREWYPIMHWGRPPPLWTESQAPVKTLPWPNFVAADKYQLVHTTVYSAKKPPKLAHYHRQLLRVID